MKKILSGTVAAIALIAAAAPAAAQTNELHYAGGIFSPLTNPANIVDGAKALTNEGALLVGIGTRYTAHVHSDDDSETATPIVNVVFTLKGKVNKDCSFYAGNNASARTIDFGVIGVRTGDNENVNSAFEMVDDASAHIDTLTAGCNFNNEVVITKSNVAGLINSAAGGYDNTEFQANIPYSVKASWKGVEQNVVTSGTGKSLTVSENLLTATKSQGAWRSAMSIEIVAPAIANKGLVAGSYNGTTTLTLRAL